MARVQRPRLRTEVTEADLAAICAAIAAGSTYSAAAAAAGVRPTALRFRKQADPAVALRLRAAWQEQGRSLRRVVPEQCLHQVPKQGRGSSSS